MKREYWRRRLYLIIVLILLGVTGCERPDPEVTVVGATVESSLFESSSEGAIDNFAITRPPTPPIDKSKTPFPVYFGTPTPDPTRPSENETNYDTHIVSVGETLSQIALTYATTVEELARINELTDSDLLAVGQQILVPGGKMLISPSFKIIPDSELVYGPGLKGFNVQQVAAEFAGRLLTYQEEVEGKTLSGPEIVQLVADRQSVSPRLLLALIEYQSAWLTDEAAGGDPYPLGYVRQGYEGLYQQLTWAANKLNLGYYGRSEGGLTYFETASGERVNFAPEINDGTAGVQLLFGSLATTAYEEWSNDIEADGFFASFNQLFGNPFAYTVDPLWPAEMIQPALELPWSQGETWYFTGGPHGGWASGSAWAALDFAPPHDQLGCYVSDTWVTAAIDGLVTRSDMGGVVIDVDGDGFPGTGWAIYYLHLESRDRVTPGMYVNAGDPIGHASCEGGFSNGTHLHIARLYNGRWVAADGSIPFNLSGWTSEGLGVEYDGLLVRGDQVKEACECREELNAIVAD